MQSPDRDHPYRRELYRVLEEREWLDKNIAELISKYASRWIGIHDRQVIEVADSPKNLRQALAARGVENCRVLFLVPNSVHQPV